MLLLTRRWRYCGDHITPGLSSYLDDGTVRIYDLPDIKAKQAIMGLNEEISSLGFSYTRQQDSRPPGVWMAFGTRAALFNISTSDKLVLKMADAVQVRTLLNGRDDENDVLNDVRLFKPRAFHFLPYPT